MNEIPVLYVEDEENDAFLLQLAFDRCGVTTPLKVVVDGRQAIQYLSAAGRYVDRQQHPFPCLVLLDLNLPVISGLEVLKWVRSQPEMSNLPVVIFSSSNQLYDVERARELGANDYIVKPVNMGRMDKIVLDLKEKWIASTVEAPTR